MRSFCPLALLSLFLAGPASACHPAVGFSYGYAAPTVSYSRQVQVLQAPAVELYQSPILAAPYFAPTLQLAPTYGAAYGASVFSAPVSYGSTFGLGYGSTFNGFGGYGGGVSVDVGRGFAFGRGFDRGFGFHRGVSFRPGFGFRRGVGVRVGF